MLACCATILPMELPPQQFLCPISLEIMIEPVILCTGISYDRVNIRKWLNSGHNTCPVTNQKLPNKDLLPNVVLQRLISTWRSHNQCDRPFHFSVHSSRLNPQLVSELLLHIEEASRPIEALARLKVLAQENKENKEMISSTKGPRILVSLLSRLSYCTKNWSPDDADVYREALGVLCSLSLDDDIKGALIHTKALSPAIEFLREADLQLKVNFLKLIEDLSKAKRFRVDLATRQGLLGKLLEILRLNVHHALIETALVTLTALCVEKHVRVTILRWGIMETLIDLLATLEGAVCEKSLVLVETLLDSLAEWRGKANKHASSIISAVTRLILRSSEASTECGVRILCKLCMCDKRCCQQAVRKGAIVKVVLVLQMSGYGTKRRALAMQLLKLLLGTACKKLHATHQLCQETSAYDINAAA